MQKEEVKKTETPTTPSQINPIKFSYVECPKQGMHYGEVCNMICVEPSCLEDLICCCACIE